MSLVDRWLDPGEPATSATCSLKPAETLVRPGSSPPATRCYLAPKAAPDGRSSSEVAATLLPEKPSKHAASVAQVAEVAASAHPESKNEPDWRRPKPPPRSLVARLCREGATARTYGKSGRATAEIEAPAGISAELVREVEARGWRIIPGGKPNTDAEHDSWLAGVPASDLKR